MSTVPTLQKIEQPETILKKRKQDNKAREEKLAKAAEAKKVCYSIYLQKFRLIIQFLGSKG